jgi:hypothetical protein
VSALPAILSIGWKQELANDLDRENDPLGEKLPSPVTCNDLGVGDNPTVDGVQLPLCNGLPQATQRLVYVDRAAYGEVR